MRWSWLALLAVSGAVACSQGEQLRTASPASPTSPATQPAEPHGGESARTEPEEPAEPEAPSASASLSPREPEPEPQPEPEPIHVDVVRSCDRLKAAPASALHVERDLAYSRAGGAPLTLDLLRPVDDAPHPAVLLFHGGGWRRGEKAHVDSMARALAGEGYVGVAVDFRNADAPRVVFPAPVADVRCAVRWVRAHAEEHGIDGDHIGAVGFSSGGHLAAMLATAADDDTLDVPGCLAPDDVSPAVQGAAVWFAPLDLSERIGHFSSRRHIKNLLGAPPEADPERTAEASPIAHVDADDAPMLIVQGTADRTVGVPQATAMRDALEQAGAAVSYCELEGAGHGFGLLTRHEENHPAVCTTLAFLSAALATD